ncbi:MAG: ThuA domain-containing protein, partial [Pirellulaceae bacterium]|nr:ThuA domain-containing protein [Pirellulaceae bacterium]
MSRPLALCAAAICLLAVSAVSAAPPYKALIVEGQNNHRVWPETSKMMAKYLTETSLFSVDIARTAPRGVDKDFKPDFSKYHVVVSNYNGAAWPEETQKSFVQFVKGGGGFVVVHAANNAFSNWREYNEIIGLGGWGGRSERSGPYVYFDDKGKLVRDTNKGRGGSHGRQHPFSVVVRDSEHPVTKGMPSNWMHANDELY